MALVVVFANPEPKAKPYYVAYSSPLVASAYVPSAAIVERSYHGNLAYPYASAPLVAASPLAYTAPVYVR